MSKAIQSARNASSVDRFVQKIRNSASFTFRHSSISVALIVAVGLGLMSLTGISGVLLGSSAAYADESVRYDVNVNSSLTLGFSANTVSLNLNPGSKTFASQDITTTVSTNNQYGYDLYVTSDGTDLINQTDNTKTISTLPAKEGGYDAETFLADKWGVMKNNTSYQPFVSGATVSQSSTVTNADNTVLTFGAKTSYNTAPGNYKLLLTFQLIPRVATNDLTINFGGSGVAEVKVCKIAGDCTGDNLVGRVTANGGLVPGLKDGSTYYLYPIFTSGYEFVSWAKTSSDASVISDTTILNPTFTMSDEPASVTVTGKSSGYAITFKTSDASSINFNGTNYTNNQTATIAAGTYQIYGNYGTRSTFKTWAKSGSGSFGNSDYQLTTFTVSGDATITLTGQSVTTAMQSLPASSCTDTPKPVYDTRDNEVYWIQKLADGNCWMLDNLRLGGTSTISLTTSNTHSSGSYTLPASGTTCFWTTADCDSSGDSTHTGYTVAAIYTASKDKVNTSTTNNWGYGSGKYGVYYNYCAASAGTICTASNSSNASYDVCPKGWKMPTGGSTGQYQSLCDTIKGESCSTSWTDDGAFHTALSAPLSGLFYYDSLTNQGSDGRFWSSTRRSAATMYYLMVYSSNARPQDSNGRFFGLSVRCILGS